MAKKPNLKFWQIWNLSFGFLGVQIGYSLQNSNTSTIFESFGANLSQLSYFWLAAPIAGLIIQPIIGLFSDGTWTRLGRRVPYILGGSIISSLALSLMPNANILITFAPLAMGALILLFMDLSFNVTMQPFRALVADMLDDKQKTKGYVVQTFLINLGAVVGAFLPLILSKLGVSDAAAPGTVAKHIAYSYYIGGAILLLTVIVTSIRTKEYPPEEFAKYNSETLNQPIEKKSFWKLLKDLPTVMLQLSVVQFFSWAALFLMWTYLKPAISGVVISHETGMILSEGQTQTWVGVLNGIYPIPACIASLFITGIAAKYGNKLIYSICLLFGAVGFIGLNFTTNQYALMIHMIGIGIAWAGILAMPYAILSKAVEPRRMGVYMGIFNFTITIPQIAIGLLGGVLVQYVFGSNAMDMLVLAGVFMLIAAISVYFVKEKKLELND